MNRMSKVRLGAVLVCSSFTLGVFVQWMPLSFVGLCVLGSVLAAGVFGATLRMRYGVYVLVCILVCGLGSMRYIMVEERYMASVRDVEAVSPEMKRFAGVVVRDRDEREKDVQVDVRLEMPHTPVVRVTLPRQVDVQYGDRVWVEGTVTFPTLFVKKEDEVGVPFDYAAYLRGQGVVGEIRYAKVEDMCIENAGACEFSYSEKIYASLYALKNMFRAAIYKTVDEPYASLMLGLLIGEKHALTKEEMQTFTDTGLSHIVVLSGFNITIIVTLVFRLFSFLPRRWNFLVGSLLAILFVAMTGFSSTAVRALCMAGIVVVGQLVYRSSVPLMSLLIVCTSMVVWNPYILRDDVSFHLSALATLGIIVFGTPLSEWMSVRLGRGAGEVMGITLAASIFAMPYVAYVFGTASLISPLSNLLVLPLVQPIMAFGALAGFLGMMPVTLFLYVSFMFGICAQALAALVFFFVENIARVPYATVHVSVPGVFVWVWFVVVGMYAWLFTSKAE